MPFNVITIARTLRSGGEELGHAVAGELGYRYIDTEIIDAAAEKAGVSSEAVAGAEERRSLLARIMESFAQTGGATTFGPAALHAAVLQARMPDFIDLIKSVIDEIAAEGNVVIVAHAAGMRLAHHDGALRILVTAPAETRAARLVAADGQALEDARKAIRESDQAREQYFERFYQIDRELPTHFDMVLNTDVLSQDVCKDLIVAAARS